MVKRWFASLTTSATFSFVDGIDARNVRVGEDTRGILPASRMDGMSDGTSKPSRPCE